MQLQIQKTEKLQGTIIPPSSKSQTIRALLIATLAPNTSILHNVLDSEDTKTALLVCQKLGATITELDKLCHGRCLEVKNTNLPLNNVAETINTGDSGITTRFILPMLGLRKNTNTTITLDCGKQMKQRPLHSLITALNNLGMQIKSLNDNGTCPLTVRSKLLGGETTVDGITSQYISALLLSCVCAEKDSKITVHDLHERPYVQMTLKWLDEQNIVYAHERDEKNNLDIFSIQGRQHYKNLNKIIPVDFSSASYPIAAAVLLPGQITLKGIDMTDEQGDKRLIKILQEMGADITINNTTLTIHGGRPLHGITINANDIPDMMPTLAVIGTQATDVTNITNVAQARLKETDRIKSMCHGLGAMGAYAEEKPDGLIIKQSTLHGAQVHGYNDHRTVMALALAGLVAEGETIIDTAEAINKTFPTYIELMKKLGAKMKLI